MHVALMMVYTRPNDLLSDNAANLQLFDFFFCPYCFSFKVYLPLLMTSSQLVFSKLKTLPFDNAVDVF